MKHLYLKFLLATFITTLGGNFAQAQFTETFEDFSNGSTSFTSDGQPFTLMGGFHITDLPGYGANESDVYIDNLFNTAIGGTYTIQTSNTATFTMKDVKIYLSQDELGDFSGGTGSVIINGILDGSTEFTVSAAGLPTPTDPTTHPGNGFIEVNFATEGGSDNSLTVIDELEFELTGNFQYIAIDDFTYDIEEVVEDTSPPFVLSIELNGTPPTTADEVSFTVTFDEAASNVTLDDFSLDAVGTTGNLSNITGSGTTYTVTVNNISGEGTISIDLNSSTDIEDTLENAGTPAFTAGENHTVSACFEEDFESFSDGASIFTSNGLPFTSTNGLVVENVDDAGASESDRYLDNNGNGSGTYAIQTTGGELFTVSSVDLYLSSIPTGAPPTNDGTITINGKLLGADVFTITKSSGFPTTLANGDNGFFNVNFATDGASDYSTTNIDELEIVIGSSFVYLAVDHFDFCEAGTTDIFPPVVQSIAVSGNPTTLETSVDFIVTFNENVTNVSTDDFSLDLNGTTGNIASVTGANNIYTVTVNNIDGEGTMSIDLNSSTDIEDALGNSGPAAFTSGENHTVSDCFTEDFESFSSGATTLTSNGKAFTTTNGLEVEFINGAGTDGSDQFLENNGAGTGSYSIQTTDESLINVNSLFLFVSSDGTGTVPSGDGTVAIRGMVDGSMVYTINLDSGNTTFPTAVAEGNNGFFEVDFATAGASDYSGINVDEVQIEILSNFVYLAIDRFRVCLDIDNTLPTIDIQGEPSIVNSTAAFGVTVQFSEDVTGFAIGDITVGNGSASNFVAVDGNTYTADITPSGAGDITMNIAAGVAQDAAGNNNTAATQAVITFDNTVPVASITGAPFIVNSLIPYNVTVDFGEIVTGFVTGDIVVENGSVTGFTDNGDGTFTIEITPSGTGDITIDIAANVAQDGAGNNNTVASTATTIYDGTVPTVDIQGEPSIVNSTATFGVTIQFSEDVTGFVIGDITVGNASASNYVAVDGNTYTVDITPSGAGNITMNIAAGVAQDAAGNNNTAATQAVTTFDNTAPAVSVTSTEVSPTANDPIPVTITFDEVVTGFVVSDITVVNGTLSNFSGSGTTYSVDVIPIANGIVTVDVSAGVATDAAGNVNSAATQFSITYNGIVQLAVESVTLQGTPDMNVNSVIYTVTFNKNANNISTDDFALTTTGTASGTIASVSASSGTAISVTITGIGGEGTIRLDLLGTTNIEDDTAEGDVPAYTSGEVHTVDVVPPSVTINSTESSPSNAGIIPVTITFDEDVTGFSIGDISAGNATLSNFSGSGTTYTVDVAPIMDGTITLNVSAGTATDIAGNSNNAAIQFSILYDGTSPGLLITSPESSPTGANPIPVTITFDENVTGFTIADFFVSNGTLSNFSGSGTTYTVNVTPVTDGVITLNVNAGVATDVAGNANTAAMQFSIEFDATLPVTPLTAQSIVLQGSPGPGAASVTYMVTFNKDVSNITRDDFTVVGTGSVSIMGTSVSSNTGTTVNVIIEGIMGQGSLKLDLLDGTDITDNTSTDPIPAFTSGEVHIVDRVAPRVYITSPEFSHTYINPIPVAITFNDEVTGFTVNDISVQNGTLTNFEGSGDSYTVDIIPGSHGIVTLDINSGAAVDDAGNPNIPATQFSIIYETTPPVGLVYPNPFRENLNIVSETDSEILKVEIFDTKGNKVYSQLIDQQGIINEIELPYLESGLYLMSLDYGNKKILRKIIKL